MSPIDLSGHAHAAARSPLDERATARLWEVRKELGKGSVVGFVGGGALGAVGYTMLPYMPLALKHKPNKNTFLATLLISASVGSFVGSLVYGKNAIQYVGDIFRTGSQSSSSYRDQLNKNEKDIVDSMGDSYERRAEAIQEALEQKRRREQGWHR
jgi:hypothetical protein